jgi:hypothetical protein
MTKEQLYNTAIEAKKLGDGEKIIAFYEGMGFVNKSNLVGDFYSNIFSEFYYTVGNCSITGVITCLLDEKVKILDFSIIEEEEQENRMNIIAQNGNEGLHYDLEDETPKHYDNTKGTLYKVAMERGWNPYLFDIVKRLERSEKKGEFKEDLRKSKVVIDLWEKESENK